MFCKRPEFICFSREGIKQDETLRPELPETLIDLLTGREMPFTNRDNIRQKILKVLLEEKGYERKDISVDRTIRFALDDHEVLSLADITLSISSQTMLILKCASGSLVSRERQVVASARLLEEYVVPFAAVTNGEDLELLDSVTEKVLGTGLSAIPRKDELSEIMASLTRRSPKPAKILNEQRILYTYDAISCPQHCDKSTSS